jgi:hypothetical protein
MDYIAFSDAELLAGAEAIGRFTSGMDGMLQDIAHGFNSVMGHHEGWAGKAAGIFTTHQVSWGTSATNVHGFFDGLRLALISAAGHLSDAERAAMARGGG